MKRYLSLLLALVLLFSLAACGAEESKEEAKKTKEEKTEEVVDGSGNISVPRGKVEENNYTSSYSGINLTFPEDPAWSFTADEDLAKEMKISKALLEGDLGTALLQGLAIKDAEATNGSYGSEFYVYYEMTPVSEESFLDKELKKLYDLPGISFDDEGEKTTTTLGGKDYLSIVVECESAGSSMTRHYYVHKDENNVITFIFANLFESDPTDVKAMFQ